MLKSNNAMNEKTGHNNRGRKLLPFCTICFVLSIGIAFEARLHKSLLCFAIFFLCFCCRGMELCSMFIAHSHMELISSL